MLKNFYTYTKFEYRCDKCGWLGFGEEMERGDSYGNGFEVGCPKCGEPRFCFVTYNQRDLGIWFGRRKAKG